MKFSKRPAAERTAISAWIRVITQVRENACMKMTDSFIKDRQESISASPQDIAKMLAHYAAYQKGRHSVSYADYFQVSNPEEYAAMVLKETKSP